MRSFRRNDRGLSEIVGTLMLVLIVVTAATLLAAFVATYQAQLQKEQSFTHDQSLESIHILALNTAVNANGTAYTHFSFILASEYINPSIILGISINNNPLLNYTWWDFSDIPHSNGFTNATHSLTLSPFEEVNITTDLNASDGRNFSYGNPTLVPVPNHYIKFDIFTILQNDFSHVFIPPVPLSVVSQINPSGENPMTLLDGSTSFQPQGNASIVSWAWTVSGGGLASTGTDILSPPATWNHTNGGLGNGSVSVTNATANFTVPTTFAWGSADSVYFTLGDNLTVTDGCVISSSGVTPGTATGVRSGTTLKVKFNFTATLADCSTSGNTATISLPAGGVTLIPTPFPLTDQGEEYEISPALPSLPGQAHYFVTLTVTDSDGLVGSSTWPYLPPTGT